MLRCLFCNCSLLSTNILIYVITFFVIRTRTRLLPIPASFAANFSQVFLLFFYLLLGISISFLKLLSYILFLCPRHYIHLFMLQSAILKVALHHKQSSTAPLLSNIMLFYLFLFLSVYTYIHDSQSSKLPRFRLHSWL